MLYIYIEMDDDMFAGSVLHQISQRIFIFVVVSYSFSISLVYNGYVLGRDDDCCWIYRVYFLFDCPISVWDVFGLLTKAILHITASQHYLGLQWYYGTTFTHLVVVGNRGKRKTYLQKWTIIIIIITNNWEVWEKQKT